MADYGYSIEHILMVDIIPDAAVRKAMNDINAGIMPFLYMWELPLGYTACEMFTEFCIFLVKFMVLCYLL